MRAMICDLVMEAIFVNFLSLGVAQFYDRGTLSLHLISPSILHSTTSGPLYGDAY